MIFQSLSLVYSTFSALPFTRIEQKLNSWKLMRIKTIASWSQMGHKHNENFQNISDI